MARNTDAIANATNLAVKTPRPPSSSSVLASASQTNMSLTNNPFTILTYYIIIITIIIIIMCIPLNYLDALRRIILKANLQYVSNYIT